MQQPVSTKGWHVAQWGTLGWIETIAKLIGVVIGWIAFSQADSALPLVLGGNPRLAAIIVLILLTIGAIGMLVIRLTQREMISLIFAILNLTGFLALLIALLRAPGQVQGLAIVFGIFYIAGELVKQQFLRVSGYTESGASTGMMVNFSRGLMIAYILFVVLMIV